MFDTEFSRTALALVGAFIFAASSVGAAIGPARMVETTPVVYADAAPPVEGAVHA